MRPNSFCCDDNSLNHNNSNNNNHNKNNLVIVDNKISNHYHPHNDYKSGMGLNCLTGQKNSFITTTATSLYQRNLRNNKSYNEDSDFLRQIEQSVKINLEILDNKRKFCFYCGVKEFTPPNSSSSIMLGRCYGCQMVYYCCQEHQHLDWLDNHMPKCAELEWVSLCELVESIPIDIFQNVMNDISNSENLFFRRECNTWTDWFEIRPNIMQIVNQFARELFNENFFRLNRSNFLNRREPSLNDLIDGFLAKVTDSFTYAMTIGDTLLKMKVSHPCGDHPLCIHLIYPPDDLMQDLVLFFEQASAAQLNEHDDSFGFNSLDQFYELLNMFPENRKGFELVFIAEVQNYSNLKLNQLNGNKINWSKTTYLRKNLLNNNNLESEIFVTFWQGTYFNYVKYSYEIEEHYTKPDLIVSFHPNFTRSPKKLLTEWSDDLRIILTNNLTCLFTLGDREEKEKAYSLLNAFQTNFVSMKSNQFSSLLLRQNDSKPNQTHAKNGYTIIIKGFNNNNSNNCDNLSIENISKTFVKSNETQYYSSVKEQGVIGKF